MIFGVFTVIHPDTLMLAIFAGIFAGAVVLGWVVSNPMYASGQASAVKYGIVVGLAAIFATVVFWSGQLIQAYLSSDVGFHRLVGRFILNIIYCIGLGIGTALGQRMYHRWQRLRRGEDALSAAENVRLERIEEKVDENTELTKVAAEAAIEVREKLNGGIDSPEQDRGV